jgi:hypothetical protein
MRSFRNTARACPEVSGFDDYYLCDRGTSKSVASHRRRQLEEMLRRCIFCAIRSTNPRWSSLLPAEEGRSEITVLLHIPPGHLAI